MKNGKVGWEPLYDDISYINDGMKRFYEFQSNPFQASLDFVISPPHAPISSFIAFVSSFLSGLNPGRTATYVYFINSVVISAIFWTIFFLIFRSKSFATFALSFLVSLPASYFFLFEFRPDLLCALLITISFLFRENRNLLHFYPLILTLAFFAKPTFVLYIFMSYITLLLSELMEINRKDLRIHFKEKVKSHLAQFFPIFVYLLFGGYNLYRYIGDAIGPQKSIWEASNNFEAFKLSVTDLNSQLGQISCTLILFISSLGIVLTYFKKGGPKVLNVWMLGIIINFLIAFQTLGSSRFFYLPAFILLFSTGIVSWKYLYENHSLELNTGLSTAITISFSVFLAMLPNPNPWGESYMRGDNGNNYQVAKVIREKNLTSVMFMFSAAVTSPTVEFLIPKDRNIKLDSLVLTLDPKSNFRSILDRLVTYDAVVFARSDMPGLVSNPPIVFPIHRFQDEFAGALREAWGLGPSDQISANWSYLLINPKLKQISFEK